jgi:cytochrome c553
MAGCSSSNVTEERDAEDEAQLPILKPANSVAAKGKLATVPKPSQDPLFELGVYLTNVAACGVCHGSDPKEPASPLSGGRQVHDQFGYLYAANITPDKETGIGTWSTSEIIRAIRSSVGKGDRPLSLELHSGYRWMSDRDARAIATYLLAAVPVKNRIERRELGVFERKRLGIFSRYSDVEGYIPAPRRSSAPAYGRYLAKAVANCAFCHTEAGGLFKSAKSFAGAQSRSGRGFFESIAKLGELLVANGDPAIAEAEAKAVLAAAESGTTTPVPGFQPNLDEGFPVGGPDIRGTSGEYIKSWTVEEIADFLSFGSSPDGRQINGALCPWPYYSTMEESDKLAIARFLKTL